MAGIYVHVPFCRKACSYCDFHFSTSLRRKDELVDAIAQEVALRRDEFPGQVDTLYFGGGTPSLLDAADLERLFGALRTLHPLDRIEEVTLEANPEDVTTEKLRAWRTLGIHRLSIGTQSFFTDDLRFMNRDHSPKQAIDAVKRAQDEGFENLTIDLIFGIPGQPLERWQENVEHALSLNTSHLSSYCLTIEPGTALHYALRKGRFTEKPEEAIEREYLYLHKQLQDKGFEHYEISNFARPGRQALHNSSYWTGEAYIGYGPSAHSFNGLRKRQWNVANNARYLRAIASGTVPAEVEHLADGERFNEVVMTGLRHSKGLDLDTLERTAPAGWMESFRKNRSHLDAEMRSWIIGEGSSLRMDPVHWLKCDALVRALIV